MRHRRLFDRDSLHERMGKMHGNAPCSFDHPLMRERWRMQRNMFVWFGAVILMTLLVVVAVMRLATREGPPMCKEESKIRLFHKVTFERVWDRPEELAFMGQQFHSQFGADLRMVDAQGREKARFGDAPCDAPKMVIDLGTPAQPMGQVKICRVQDPDAADKAWRLGLALFAAGCTVWALSGLLARRVARPLAELTRFAQDLGGGKFSARVNTGSYRGEVGVLGIVLNDMADRIEKQMADQRALLATVSHELRTPLARMRILVEMARDKCTDPVQLDKIDAEVVEIDQLVSELLANSRVDFSALAMSPLDARTIATDALERADVDPTVLSFEAPHPAFRGDPTLVARAVLNLLENAKRHGRGVTELRVYQRGDHLAFEVHDQGPGLASDEAEKIFQPFYRGRNGDGRSVGLGLALVKRIAQAHGGDAYAQNHPEGKGACVGVTFSAPVSDPVPVPTPSQSRQPVPVIA